MAPEPHPGKLICRPGHVPGLDELLRRHPRATVEAGTPRGALDFQDGGRTREIVVGCHGEPFGLVELMDNNPLVCTDAACVPDPLSTLALVALGPLIRAGLILERPVIVTDCEAAPDELDRALEACGLRGGATTEIVDAHGPCVFAVAMVAVPTPGALDDLDALFDEAFGRSFFVRRVESAEWEACPVEGKPYAAYTLRITPGESESLLSIHVKADRSGKCGAAQIVHVMNIMVGFEETLGLR